MPKFLKKILYPEGRLTKPRGLMLSSLALDNSANKRRNLSGLDSMRGLHKTFLNCGGQACRIISVQTSIAGKAFK